MNVRTGKLVSVGFNDWMIEWTNGNKESKTFKDVPCASDLLYGLCKEMMINGYDGVNITTPSGIFLVFSIA